MGHAGLTAVTFLTNFPFKQVIVVFLSAAALASASCLDLRSAKCSESKLTGIINQAPQLPAQASLPQSSTIITLDDGRILIPLAIPRRLGIVSTLLARPVWKRNNHQGCLCPLR